MNKKLLHTSRESITRLTRFEPNQKMLNLLQRLTNTIKELG